LAIIILKKHYVKALPDFCHGMVKLPVWYVKFAKLQIFQNKKQTFHFVVGHALKYFLKKIEQKPKSLNNGDFFTVFE
jgi:hypothetical protein